MWPERPKGAKEEVTARVQKFESKFSSIKNTWQISVYRRCLKVFFFCLIFVFVVIIVVGGSQSNGHPSHHHQGNPEFKLVEVEGSHHVHLNQPDKVRWFGGWEGWGINWRNKDVETWVCIACVVFRWLTLSDFGKRPKKSSFLALCKQLLQDLT